MLGALATALGDVKMVPGKDYHVLSVSFDVRDTPAVAQKIKKNYMVATGMPFPDDAWLFLTGDSDAIEKLTGAAGFRFQAVGKEFVHPSVLIFLSPEGKITKYLPVETFRYGTQAPIRFFSDGSEECACRCITGQSLARPAQSGTALFSAYARQSGELLYDTRRGGHRDADRPGGIFHPSQEEGATILNSMGFLSEHGRYRGILAWLMSTDHKRIGLMYLCALLTFFSVGASLGVLIRLSLIAPGYFLSAQAYNEVFTMHGIVMIFLFIIPGVPVAFGNFLLPIMIGARDVAFPRINRLSWWLYLAGAALALLALSFKGQPPDTGWTFYAPYSQQTQQMSHWRCLR